MRESEEGKDPASNRYEKPGQCGVLRPRKEDITRNVAPKKGWNEEKKSTTGISLMELISDIDKSSNKEEGTRKLGISS